MLIVYILLNIYVFFCCTADVTVRCWPQRFVSDDRFSDTVHLLTRSNGLNTRQRLFAMYCELLDYRWLDQMSDYCKRKRKKRKMEVEREVQEERGRDPESERENGRRERGMR